MPKSSTVSSDDGITLSTSAKNSRNTETSVLNETKTDIFLRFKVCVLSWIDFIGEHVYISLLLPEDRFPARVNKLIIAGTFLMIPLLICNAAGGLITAIFPIPVLSTGNRALDIAVAIRDIAVIIPFIFCWLSVKKSWLHPRMSTLIWQLCCFAYFTMAVLTNVDVTFRSPLFLLSIIAVMSKASRFYLVWYFILFCISSYNDAIFAKKPSSELIYLSFSNHENGFYAVIMAECASVASFVMSIALVHLQAKECEKMVVKAEFGLLIATSVAGHLLMYDTRRANDVLNIYVHQPNADGAFAETLRRIVVNMEAYRPFLPNYILSEHTSQGVHLKLNPNKLIAFLSERDIDPISIQNLFYDYENEEENSTRDDSPNSTASEQSGSRRPSFCTEDSSQTSISIQKSNLGVSKFTRMNDHRRSHSSASTLSDGGLSLPGAVPNRSDSLLSNTRNNTALIGIVPTPFSSSIKQPSQATCISLGNSAPRRPATLGLVHYVSILLGDKDSLVQNMTEFVDKVHGMAEDTSATIHGLYGDTIQLSWNTTRRVSQHETKAAIFLARCKLETGCVGAICSGPVRFQFCGTKQLMPLVYGNWLRDLHVLLWRFSVSLGINVSDHHTCRNYTHAVRSQCFAAYSIPERNELSGHFGDGSRVHSYSMKHTTDFVNAALIRVMEIVDLRTKDNNSGLTHYSCSTEKNNEWMYELEQNCTTIADTTCDVVTRSTELCIKGKTDEAAALLSTVYSENTMALAPPSVRFLWERLRMMQNNPLSFRKEKDDDSKQSFVIFISPDATRLIPKRFFS